MAELITPCAHKVAEIDDLLTAILLHLPITSLLRFKSVSKRWLSIISSAHFSHIRSRNIETATGLFVNRCVFSFVPLNVETSVIATPKRDHIFANAILQSCNGLMCCYDLKDLNDFRSKYVYIYNPTTNLHTLIPDPTYRVFNSKSVRSVNLAFDPTKSAFYKVVCVYLSDSVPDYSYDPYDSDFSVPLEYFEIEMYSSETGLWKHAVDPFTTNIDFKYGVFWNGAINWVYHEDHSLYFNVEEECLGKFTLPPLPQDQDYRNIVYFGESSGHLHLIQINSAPATQFLVYEMERDYSAWFVKYHVDIESVVEAFPEAINDHSYHLTRRFYDYSFGILSLVRVSNDEETFLVVTIQGMQAIRYNISDKTFRKLCDFVPRADNYTDPLISWRSGYQYIESLACV